MPWKRRLAEPKHDLRRLVGPEGNTTINLKPFKLRSLAMGSCFMSHHYVPPESLLSSVLDTINA